MYLYLTNIEISPLSEYHGPVWPADVWPSDDIQLMEIKYFFSIFTLYMIQPKEHYYYKLIGDIFFHE